MDVAGKSPTRYCPDERTTCWAWFRMYANHPPGFRPSLLPGAVFDAMRVQEGVRAEDEAGNPILAIGFESAGAAVAALRRVLAEAPALVEVVGGPVDEPVEVGPEVVREEPLGEREVGLGELPPAGVDGRP
jgi:hypothetical protein